MAVSRPPLLSHLHIQPVNISSAVTANNKHHRRRWDAMMAEHFDFQRLLFVASSGLDVNYFDDRLIVFSNFRREKIVSASSFFDVKVKFLTAF